MRRKEYETPTMQVVEVRQQPQLLAGSVTSASGTIDDYQDGGTITWD